jgi:hypothetical protein
MASKRYITGRSGVCRAKIALVAIAAAVPIYARETISV